MKTFRIADLRRSTRNRLRIAIKKARFADARPKSLVEPAIALVAVVVALGGLYFNGYGRPGRGVIQPTSILWAYGALGLLIGVLSATLVRRIRSRELRGTYVLQGEWIEADRDVIRIWSFDEIESVELETHASHSPERSIQMSTELRVTFPEGDEVTLRLMQGEQLRAHLDKQRNKVCDARATGDDRWLLNNLVFEGVEASTVRMDAAHGPYRSAQQRDAGPVKADSPNRVVMLVAAVSSAAAVVGIGTTRNHFSDEAAFNYARRVDRIPVWTAYAEHGRNHVQEVREEHLPRLRMRQARGGGPDALREFARRHAGTELADEVLDSVRDAMPEQERALQNRWSALDSSLRDAFGELLQELDDPLVRPSLRLRVQRSEHNPINVPDVAIVERDLRTRFSQWWGRQWAERSWHVGGDEIQDPTASALLVYAPRYSEQVYRGAGRNFHGVEVELTFAVEVHGTSRRFSDILEPPESIDLNSFLMALARDQVQDTAVQRDHEQDMVSAELLRRTWAGFANPIWRSSDPNGDVEADLRQRPVRQ